MSDRTHYEARATFCNTAGDISPSAYLVLAYARWKALDIPTAGRMPSAYTNYLLRKELEALALSDPPD